VKLRTLLLFAVAAPLGAAVVVLPALAASEAKTVEAVAPGCDSYWPTYACWTPINVTISSGGVVKFVDPGTLEQEVRWTGGPATPACEKVPSTKQKGPWEGSCTFTQPGTYSFQGADFYVTGHVTVPSSGTTPTGTTGTTGTTTGTGTTGTGTTGTSTNSSPSNHSGSNTSSSGSQTMNGGPAGGSSPLGSVFLGSASSAVKLPASQHGSSVHGSVAVSQAGSGGRLEVQLLAARASLASAGHPSRVQVGRVVRAALHAGTSGFSVRIDAKARHALRARGHLALRVKIVLTPAHGSPVTVTRSVTLRG
jgi:hypothetical protein